MQFTPIHEDAPIQCHWKLLHATNSGNPWRESVDEFTGDPCQFQERHYSEFLTFLPYVQRFLYGEGKRTSSDVHEEAAIRVFRRDDIARVRMVFPGPNAAPATLTVAHVEMYRSRRRRAPSFALGDAIPPTGSQMGTVAIVPSRWNGSRPRTRCSLCRTMITAKNTSRLSASIGRSVSPLTGNFCSNRWCCTIQKKQVRFGIDRSNTI